jgi:hypothetical protein
MSVTDFFPANGWHCEPAILEPGVVARARDFLAARLTILHKQFEKWSGLSVTDASSYARHQQQLPLFESASIPKDLRHYLTGEFDLDTRLDACITDLLSTSRCRDFICGFLRRDCYYVHYPPMIRFKIADAPSNLVPLHQDVAYNRHLNEFVTVWVPLVDIDEECGGVIVYERSQFLPTLQHEVKGAWANRAVVDVSQFRRHHVLMQAGDALLFPPSLLHESAPHRTAHIRYSVDFRVFFNAANTKKSYYDPFTRSIRRVD